MSKRANFIVRTGVLAAAAVFMALGIKNNELTEIARKAVTMCLECIGIA